MKSRFVSSVTAGFALNLLLQAGVMVAQNGNPLTNDEVLTMVNMKMPESVIVAAIKRGPGEYDTLTNELIRLNAAGVTEGELNAMSAAGHEGAGAQPETAGDNADAILASKSRMPKAMLMRGYGFEGVFRKRITKLDRPRVRLCENMGKG